MILTYFNKVCIPSLTLIYFTRYVIYNWPALSPRCVFHGTAEELTSHLDGNCPYEEIKEFLWRTDNRITDLQVANNQKDQDIGFLRSMLGKLSEKVDNLEKNAEIKFGRYMAMV